MEPLTPEELDACVEITERLVALRQNKCQHLAVENIGPQMFAETVVRLMTEKRRAILIERRREATR